MILGDEEKQIKYFLQSSDRKLSLDKSRRSLQREEKRTRGAKEKTE